MIDVDESGTLEKEEVVVAIRGNKKVINFLVNCGNKNLQYLLVPSRLESALAQMDTDHDGTIDADEWEECIEKALANKLEQRAAAREAQSKAAMVNNAAGRTAASPHARPANRLRAAVRCDAYPDRPLEAETPLRDTMEPKNRTPGCSTIALSTPKLKPCSPSMPIRARQLGRSAWRSSVAYS